MTTLFDLTKAVAELVATTVSGAATSGTDATLSDLNLGTIFPADYFNGGTLWILSGVHAGGSVVITDYAPALAGPPPTPPTFSFLSLGLGAIGGGDMYMAARINYPRNQLIQAVNTALRAYGTTLKDNVFLVSVKDQGQYDLPANVPPGSIRRVQVSSASEDHLAITATAGAATSFTAGALAGVYANDYFNGGTIRITSGTYAGQYRTITDYVGATGEFIFDAFPAALLVGTTGLANILGAYFFQTHYWWREINGKLEFDHYIPSDDDLVIRLLYMAPHDALDSDADEIDDSLNIERLVSEAALEAFRLRTRSIGDDDPNLIRDITDMQKRVDILRYRYPTVSLPRDPHLANV